MNSCGRVKLRLILNVRKVRMSFGGKSARSTAIYSKEKWSLLSHSGLAIRLLPP